MKNMFIDANFYLARFNGKYDGSYLEHLPAMTAFLPHQRVPMVDIGWNREAALVELESIKVGDTIYFGSRSEPAMKAIMFLLPQAEVGDIFISPDGTIFHLVSKEDAENNSGKHMIFKDIPENPEYSLVEVHGRDEQLITWVMEHYSK